MIHPTHWLNPQYGGAEVNPADFSLTQDILKTSNTGQGQITDIGTVEIPAMPKELSPELQVKQQFNPYIESLTMKSQEDPNTDEEPSQIIKLGTNSIIALIVFCLIAGMLAATATCFSGKKLPLRKKFAHFFLAILCFPMYIMIKLYNWASTCIEETVTI
jgi:ABC-type maltose transport system permease subunit